MLFGKKQDPTPAPAETLEGKGRKTPTRKEAQAARMRPLVVNDRKAARAEARKQRNAAYAKQREAMQTGDERFLPARDRGPVRRFARDYVDAGWNVGEYFMPLALFIIIALFAFNAFPIVAFWATTGAYAVVFLGLFHAMWQTAKMRRVALQFFPSEELKGMRFYAFSRIFQLRRWRLPKPQVKRGEWPMAKLKPLQ